MKKLVIIADDLTGAMDTGAFPVSCGAEVIVLTTPEFHHIKTEDDVLTINADTRKMDKESSCQTHIVLGQKLIGQSEVYVKKIDMGFRGNVACEIKGLMHGANFPVCFLIAAIPEFNTFTLYGHQYVKGKILSESIYTVDPSHPPKSSYIPDILGSDEDFPIAAVGIDMVRGDLLKTVEELINQGARIIVLDALTNKDCSRIVELLAPACSQILWAGTLGLIQAISIYLFGSLKPPVFNKHLVKCACFSASDYPATRAQIEKSKNNGLKVVQLDIDSLSCDMQNDDIEKVVADCILASTEGDFILIPRISSMCFRENIGDLILDSITNCAANLCHRISFDRLIIIGGDTASALLAKLGVYSIRITGKPESGIAFGVILNGKFKGIEIATKGGSVGSLLALEKMRSKVDSTYLLS